MTHAELALECLHVSLEHREAGICDIVYRTVCPTCEYQDIEDMEMLYAL